MAGIRQKIRASSIRRTSCKNVKEATHINVLPLVFLNLNTCKSSDYLMTDIF